MTNVALAGSRFADSVEPVQGERITRHRSDLDQAVEQMRTAIGEAQAAGVFDEAAIDECLDKLASLTPWDI